MNSRPDVFVVGDVHGHHDRLIALLDKAGVDDRDCIVVQCGDLGHFGRETYADDLTCWRNVYDKTLKVDIVIWGNHDRAVIDTNHTFGGYSKPHGPEIKHMMNAMEADGRLRLAYAAHGWLITHAGYSPSGRYPDTTVDRTDAEALAQWLCDEKQGPVIDAVSRYRGGWSEWGGILWRDVREDLWDGVPQVFGHSADKDHLVRGEQDQWFCVDIGGKGGWLDPDAACLAGLWLPSQEIIRVDMNLGKDNEE